PLPPTPPHPLSLHDALPISCRRALTRSAAVSPMAHAVSASSHHGGPDGAAAQRSNITRPFASSRPGVVTVQNERPSGVNVCQFRDRKSTRLNSSHDQISYAV